MVQTIIDIKKVIIKKENGGRTDNDGHLNVVHNNLIFNGENNP